MWERSRRRDDERAVCPFPDSYTPRHLAEWILKSRSALEGERRQVTVLFCDIVDSTPLAAALGSEGMHELLNEFFGAALDEIHHYEGTINQFLGDGFMALFGAPIADEDHLRRAALAALGIRKQVEKRRAEHTVSGWRDVQVRMGLNSGFLVVGKIGNDLRMDYTAVGDTTNVAARIQSAARPGEILMSDSARRLSRGYINVEALPPAMVKGKSEPIELYRVIGVGTRRSPIEMIEGQRPTPFVGRTRDLAVLGEALSRIRSGHGEVVDIEGEPGAGKSRLVHEFLGMLPHGATHLVGRCVAYGGSIPYLPILDVLREYCGIVEVDEAEVVAKKLRDVLEEAGRRPEADVPYLLHFLGIKEGTETLALVDPATIKGRAFEIMRETFIRSARQRPLVLTVEDLHWIDASSHEFLAELAAAVLILTRGEGNPFFLEGQADTEANRRRRVTLVLRQFPVYHFLHGHQEYYDLMTRHEPIVDALGDPGLRGSFLAQLGQRVGVFTEFERAREMLTEAAALCDATGNAVDAAHAYVMLEWIDMMTGDYTGAELMWERALERLQEASVSSTYMFCDVGVSLAYAASGRWQDAVRAAQVGFERGEDLSDDGIMAFCGAVTSYVYLYQGDRDRAIEHAHQSLARAPTVYFRGWAALPCGGVV